MNHPDTHRLPCGFTEERLIAAALDESSQEDSRAVAEHLTHCAACAALIAGYRRLRAHLDALTVDAGDAAGLAAARRQLDARLAGPARPRLHVDVWHSPVGDLRIGRTDRGVALVEFVRPERPGVHRSPGWQADFDVERGGPDLPPLVSALDDYFSGRSRDLGWTVDDTLMRSDFQRSVLRATAEVPYGTVVTYQGIADAIGQPSAVRAVAQALRHNPVPIHIPCHRVIGSDGTLTGYAGNLVGIKKRILEVEGIPVVETPHGLAISRQRVYVGWRGDRWFCRPRCSTLKEQAAGDRTFIASRDLAEEMGYQPCDVCRPDDPLVAVPH
jgi:methylated-DNA-[protein]-cysteine S-methyltransferase